MGHGSAPQPPVLACARAFPCLSVCLSVCFNLRVDPPDARGGCVRQVGVEEEQVRAYFQKLRNSVRNFVQRMQRKATEHSQKLQQQQQQQPAIQPPAAQPPAIQPQGVPPSPAAAAGAAAVPQAAGAQAAQAAAADAAHAEERLQRSSERLRMLLDASGGIADPGHAGLSIWPHRSNRRPLRPVVLHSPVCLALSCSRARARQARWRR
jgi:hypothetical protein